MFMINFTSRRYRTNPFNCVCTWVCNLATKTAYEECIDRVGRGLQLSIFIYTDDIGQKLLQKKVTPDQVYTYLRLNKVDNRVTILGETQSHKLWKEFSKIWKKAHPRWESQLKGPVY
ncbi:hypothetical protein PI124_g21818 [Phytophthora idaei]|nr:hypothetical protein PI124_g21818 [Phytophthora idaei]